MKRKNHKETFMTHGTHEHLPRMLLVTVHDQENKTKGDKIDGV